MDPGARPAPPLPAITHSLCRRLPSQPTRQSAGRRPPTPQGTAQTRRLPALLRSHRHRALARRLPHRAPTHRLRRGGVRVPAHPPVPARVNLCPVGSGSALSIRAKLGLLPPRSPLLSAASAGILPLACSFSVLFSALISVSPRLCVESHPPIPFTQTPTI